MQTCFEATRAAGRVAQRREMVAAGMEVGEPDGTSAPPRRTPPDRPNRAV